MLHRLRPLALLFFAVFALNGCYTGRYHSTRLHSHHHHGSSGGGDLALAAAVGLLAGVAIAESERPPREPEPLYYQPIVYVNAPPQPASAKDRVETSQARSFDAKGARAALGAVDLAACREEGAPRGYGHAQVTFNPDGKASKVVVDTPDGLSPSAVKCIGDRLGAATVPEYEGSYITVGTTWFVR